jgi:hypothetical protein
VNKEAKELVGNLMPLYIDELLIQVNEQRQREGEKSVKVEHIEKITARLLLQF